MPADPEDGIGRACARKGNDRLITILRKLFPEHRTRDVGVYVYLVIMHLCANISPPAFRSNAGPKEGVGTISV